MLESIKSQKLKIILIFFAFLLFLLNSTGIFNFTVTTRPSINLNSTLISQVFVIKEFYIFLLTGILLSLLLPVLNPVKASLLTFVCMGIPALLNYISPGNAHLPMEYSLMTILILYIVNILINYFMEQHSKQEIINVFGKYIPPHLVQEISRSPGKVSLESQTREMTVMFCDLHNFTSSSESLSPQQISRMLNIYFTEMSDLLHGCNATIDKFIGDAVMAFWGAPFSQSDHARLSIIASFKMQDAIGRLGSVFLENGWSATEMGIGISTGRMHVGNMGSRQRIAYTVVGDPVNLASRIETLTRKYKVPTIVSESTTFEATDFQYRELDTVIVRGKKAETRIFQPICQKDQTTEAILKELEKQQQALQLYYEKNYKESSELFNQLDEKNPADLYYRVMKDKTAAL